MSSIIKDLGNGQSSCPICEVNFKTKTLTAHLNGRKHRESVLRLKQLAASTSSPVRNGDRKHKLLEEEDDDQNASRVQGVSKRWRLSFYNCVKDSSIASTSGSSSTSTAVSVIEGLPQGFFDDERMNSRLRETMEYQKHMDAELNRFFDEVAEIDDRKEEELDERVENLALQRDIDQINEHIAGWRSLNHLEMRREKLFGPQNAFLESIGDGYLLPSSSAMGENEIHRQVEKEMELEYEKEEQGTSGDDDDLAEGDDSDDEDSSSGVYGFGGADHWRSKLL